MLFVGLHMQSQGNESKEDLLERVGGLATSISPQWMVWSHSADHCRLLINLEVTESYWKIQLQKKYGSTSKYSWCGMLRNFLEEFLMDDKQGRQKGQETSVVLASHPWQCVLMLEHMQQRSLHGVYLLSEKLAENVFQDISWGSWWSCIHKLSTHWNNALSCSQKSKNYEGENWPKSLNDLRLLSVDHFVDGKPFDQRSWTRSVERLSRACRVLDRSTPYQIFVLGKSQLARRYGKRLARVMQWSFSSHKETSFSLFKSSPLQSFPWDSHVDATDISIERNLDHPVSSWEQCSLALEEDFSRLGSHSQVDASLFVLSLEWRLTFSDMSLTTLPVLFRYPTQICFLSHQKAALTQAYYTFEDMQSHLQARDASTEDLFIEPKSIVRWELCISKKMRSLPAMKRFLDINTASSDASSQEDLERLQNLEIQLPVALEGFSLQEDWPYQDSYSNKDGRPGNDLDQTVVGAGSLCSIQATAAVRPLYIFDQPQELKRVKNTGALWSFCERVMSKWWVSCKLKKQKLIQEPKNNQIQNFYKFVSTDGNQLWVSQGSNRDENPWMVHGIYA